MSWSTTAMALVSLYAAYTANQNQERNREIAETNQKKREAWQRQQQARADESQEKSEIDTRNELLAGMDGGPQLDTKARGLGLRKRVRRDTLSPKPSGGYQKQSYGYSTGYSKATA